MKTDNDFLHRAIELAKESVSKGGFPAGALIVKDGEIISEGISIGNIIHDPTSHAESVAIREACKKLSTSDLKGAILYSSLEPCLMCFSSMVWSGISKSIYVTKKTDEMASNFYYEGLISIRDVNEKNNFKIDIECNPELEEESLVLIKNWEAQLSK